MDLERQSKTDSMNAIILDEIVKSAIGAFDDYLEMSDGECWIRHTPEYWYTTAIARALSSAIPQRHVLLENSVFELRNKANRKKLGAARKAYRTGGRADISLWTKNWKPRTIVEIKKGWSWSNDNFQKDIDRILASLEETGRKGGLGTIDSGFFVILTDECDGERSTAVRLLQRRYEKVKENTKRAVSEMPDRSINTTLHLGTEVAEDESQMAVIVCQIT